MIPLNVSSGQVHWSANGDGMMIGRSEQADLENGISSNYACMNCCGDIPYTDTQKVMPGTATVDTEASFLFTAEEQYLDCYGNYSEFTFVTDATWTSSAPEVATVESLNGNVTGAAPGSATITASWHENVYHYNPATHSCVPHQNDYSKSATVIVKPLPDHLITFNDQQGYTTQTATGTCGTQYFIRQVGFQIVSSDSTGAVNIGNTDIKENYDTVTTNTCGNGQPVPDSTCTLTAAGVGRFIETMSTGCGAANGAANCGYSIDWTWYWCGDSNHGQTALAALNGKVDRDAVLFCHRTDAWPAGSPFYPVFGPP